MSVPTYWRFVLWPHTIFLIWDLLWSNMRVTNGIIFGWVFVSRINFSLMITKAEKIVIQNCHKINQKWLTEELSDKVVYYHFIYVVVSSSCFYNHIWKETLNSCKTIKLHGSCYRRFLANSIPKNFFHKQCSQRLLQRWLMEFCVNLGVFMSHETFKCSLTLGCLWSGTKSRQFSFTKLVPHWKLQGNNRHDREIFLSWKALPRFDYISWKENLVQTILNGKIRQSKLENRI